MSTENTSSLRHNSTPGSSQRLSDEEHCVDPVEDRLSTQDLKTVHITLVKDANRKESETTGFIPGTTDHSSVTQNCNICTFPESCRRFICNVLTCGLYRVCQNSSLAPCLVSNESSLDKPEKISLQNMNPVDDKEQAQTDWLGDVHIAGVKVESVGEYIDEETKSLLYVHLAGGQTQLNSLPLRDSTRFDDWEDGEEDVDSLIAKKLLELYTEYQIEELARCTSDSVFLRKSKAINQLINSLAEEHKMDELEAECRLVRGIIRISTKRMKRRPLPSRMEWTLSDSGNETMRESESFSCSNNNDYKSNPNIQISELTSTDKCAREMWRNSAGSCSPTSYSASHTETNSSGVLLLHSSVKK